MNKSFKLPRQKFQFNFPQSSPSGIQLKSKDEVKSYLLKEGTCKCGLECPLNLESFDFDDDKQSEIRRPPTPACTNDPRLCSHKNAIASLAAVDKTPNFLSKINHLHNPIKMSKKGMFCFVIVISFVMMSISLFKVE